MNDSSTQDKKLNYLNAGDTVKSWLLTVDHKRIGIMYLIAMSCFFLIGGTAAGLFRLELATAAPDLLSNDTYNKLFTMHGIIMVFFFLIPAVPGVLGNFLVPLMIGAKDVAFPRLNLASWYIYMLGGMFTLAAVLLGGIDTGWTFYTPYSSVYADSNVILAGTGVFITGFSSILTGLNFIVTIHKMRAPGMRWMRLPLFIWAQYATSIINILGTPVLAITLLLVVFERGFGFGIFDPQRGGDPVLYQHLFWFYSHPAVYIMILPGFGVVSEVLACCSRKRIYGYEFVAFSSLAIAAIGFFVWGHHMFVSSQSEYVALIFSVLTFLVGIPTAIKIFNWTATLYKGSIELTASMLYTLGFIGLFLVGGLTGLFLATMATNVHLTDTYFVVAHFHYVMVGGMMMAWLAGLHFWWPKMFGKMYNEFWARVGAVVIFFGFNFTFFPQFIAGNMGMPRRYHVYALKYEPFQMLSTTGAVFMGIGLLICAVTLISSLFKKENCGRNPWKATGLEWNQADSPPHPHNFTEPVIVDVEAYDYTDERIYKDA
jgi:cytochrome c oxidase subunit 1